MIDVMQGASHHGAGQRGAAKTSFAAPALVDPDIVASALCEAALAGSAAIFGCCLGGRPTAAAKPDGSPVTQADLASDLAVRKHLGLSFPGTVVVSEETVAEELSGNVFILVDPLDGTRDFVAGGDHWCVAVALIVAGRAVAGAIAAPHLKQVWFGGRHAYTAKLTDGFALAEPPRPIHVKPSGEKGPVLLVSRFHREGRSEKIIQSLHPSARTEMSSAIKFGLIAEGAADAHIRCGTTMEWDTAAGDAILTAAGGKVCGLDGASLHYGNAAQHFTNPPFVAASSSSLAAIVTATAQRES